MRPVRRLDGDPDLSPPLVRLEPPRRLLPVRVASAPDHQCVAARRSGRSDACADAPLSEGPFVRLRKEWPMLVRHVALVDEKSRVKSSQLSRVAAAIQKQATRDFAPVWGIQATVDSFTRLEDVPIGYWPVILKDRIAGAAGYHDDDDDGQPFALVEFDPDWALTASHEALEMLADPFGRRLIAGQSPHPKQGRVSFLVEVC